MGKIAVCGLGQSVNLFMAEEPLAYDLTIGVNDIYRYINTDINVCVDKPTAFTPERLRVINQSTPKIFYSQMVMWDKRPDFKKINILPGYPDRICDLKQNGFWKSFCSPFIAVQVAWRLHGATEVHLFGVDLINHPHLDYKLCQKIKVHFVNLRHALKDMGCRMIVHGNGILTA